MTDYTPNQMKAIEKTKGPCVILAGAGTGKTFTLAEKIKYLTKSIKPSEILCLTFSNEATNNIKNKVDNSEVSIKTFHSFCADLIREYGNWVKVNYDFDILMEDDAIIFVCKYLNIDSYHADLYLRSMSVAKDLGVTLPSIEEYVDKLKKELIKEYKNFEEYALELDILLKTNRDIDREKKREIKDFLNSYNKYSKYNDFVNAWKEYEKLKGDKKLLDFGDLTLKALEILDRVDISKRYKYIIVDEFQDTNKLQYDLIRKMDINDITIVGDLNQSIYGFRGSFSKIFDEFKKEFKVKEIDKLDESFRNTNKILRLAHKLILNNRNEECFLIKNKNKIEGENIELVELKNEAEEARKISEIIQKNIKKGVPLKEICVLYRTHKQGRAIIETLLSKDIPISTAGEIDLLFRPVIKTCINYLSIINNLRERTGTGEQAYWNLFHYSNNLSPEDSIKIARYIKSKRDKEISIDYALINNLKDINLSAEGNKIVKRVLEKLYLLKDSLNKSLPELVLDIYESIGLNRRFSYERTPENIEAMMNLRDFYNLASDYESLHKDGLHGFIQYLETVDKANITIPASKITDENSVRVMTLHAVKGLEFKVVILTNLADARFPIQRTPREPLIPKELMPSIASFLKDKTISDEEYDDVIKQFEKEILLKEERRLCYVGITRAKEKLYLTFSRLYKKETGPSIFLTEMGYDEIKKELNKEVDYEYDDEDKATIFSKLSENEEQRNLLKKQFIESLDSEDFKSSLDRLGLYFTLKDEKIPDFDCLDKENLKKYVKAPKSRLIFDKENFTFSPTKLIVYKECPKKYELSEVLQMPERGAFGFSGASTGTLIHAIAEEGVKKNLKTYEDFEKILNEKVKLNEFKGVDLDDAKKLLKIFFIRNKGVYDENTITEIGLRVDLNGLKFYGKADRIDRRKDGDVIVDYKTQKTAISPEDRNIQMGYYAIASRKKNFKPIKIILDMLRQEKPIEMEIKGDEVSGGRLKGFNLKEVEKELIAIANNIVNDYEKGFKVTEDANECRDCRYKFYCVKGEE